ncbi:MAG: hypothetical protein Q8J68_06715 [Methanolobus sp.]|uniref:hypothetical protein n=1 Tax=Methanolobus sp. TaxID=1874737 RepID=UPI00272F7B93|nr:hypothetical protein [Methanolobus sp.]MDP2216956.1 hypothetical protein [Methanolobus sp.]
MPVRRVRVDVGISYGTDLGRPVKNDLAIAIHNAFNREGINIPFPKMDVHIRNNPGYNKTLIKMAVNARLPRATVSLFL